MSIRTNNQVSHVPPYYYFAEDQEQKLQALWSNKRSGGKRRLRSLLSRRSARR